MKQAEALKYACEKTLLHVLPAADNSYRTYLEAIVEALKAHGVDS